MSGIGKGARARSWPSIIPSLVGTGALLIGPIPARGIFAGALAIRGNGATGSGIVGDGCCGGICGACARIGGAAGCIGAVGAAPIFGNRRKFGLRLLRKGIMDYLEKGPRRPHTRSDAGIKAAGTSRTRGYLDHLAGVTALRLSRSDPSDCAVPSY